MCVLHEEREKEESTKKVSFLLNLEIEHVHTTDARES